VVRQSAQFRTSESSRPDELNAAGAGRRVVGRAIQYVTALMARLGRWHGRSRCPVANDVRDYLALFFELYRTLDQDERDNVAAAPTIMPARLMTA
jgi:hypothetical protein